MNLTTTFHNEKILKHIFSSSPWRAMRQLGENFGYYVPVTPLTGQVSGVSGDRKTCIWTLVSSKEKQKVT